MSESKVTPEMLAWSGTIPVVFMVIRDVVGNELVVPSMVMSRGAVTYVVVGWVIVIGIFLY